MENIVFGHITLSMLVSFLLGILCLFLYCWKTNQASDKTNRYMNLTVPNILFHLVASFLVLNILHEISGVVIENFIPALKTDNIYHNTLAALTGMFGSVLVAWVIDKSKKFRRNGGQSH